MFTRVFKTWLSVDDCAPLGWFGTSALALCLCSAPASMAQSIATPAESSLESAWSSVTLTAQLESNSGDAVQGLEASHQEDSSGTSEQPAEQEKTSLPIEPSTDGGSSGLKLNFDALDDEDDAAATSAAPIQSVETPANTVTQEQPGIPVPTAPEEAAPKASTSEQSSSQPAPSQPAPVQPAPSRQVPTQLTPNKPAPRAPIPQPAAPGTRTDNGLSGTAIGIVIAAIVLTSCLL